MDKLISSPTSNTGVTISNDGATIMKLLQVEHPAAKALVDVSMSQDAEVGDGTTSVVLLTASILQEIKGFVEEGIHPCILMKYVKMAGDAAVEFIKQHSSVCSEVEQEEEMLLKCARTALNSKLIASHEDLFAPMIVRAVLTTLANSNTSQGPGLISATHLRNRIAIQKVPGGDVRQSFLVSNGVAFPKSFSYAGFEQMPKHFEQPKILLLNVELELKNEKENAEVRIDNPADYQSIVNAEYDILYKKLQACVDSGAHIILSKLPIGDIATQYFADRHRFCAGRVSADNLQRVADATGAIMQTSVSSLTPEVIGTCGEFQEKQVGDARINIFTETPNSSTCTIVLRGGSDQFIAESERSVHDALMVVSRSLHGKSVVAGGGAVEMVLARYLRKMSLGIEGKGQLIVSAFAKALEVIPRQLAENAGFDATDVLSLLHSSLTSNVDEASNGTAAAYGVDIVNGGICNTYERGIWEPALNKIHSLAAATEAAALILSIDETVRNPRSQAPDATGMPPPGAGNKPLTNMMGNAMDAVNASKGGSRSGNLGNGVSYMKGRG